MHLGQRVPARLGARHAGLGADPAVLMHVGVLAAFLSAGAACLLSTGTLDPVRREAMAPVAVQMSAQSRFSRMHCFSISTDCSARQASAQEVHVWEQE
jgi:hypothetical protein